MKNKWAIGLAVLITSGIVFAAAKTTFYSIIDMQGNRITNMGNPQSDSDAATKYYVKNTFLPQTGGNIYGTLNMRFHPILNVAVSNSHSAVPKVYVDGVADRGKTNMYAEVNGVKTSVTNLAANIDTKLATKLPLSGGMMSGQINMFGHRIYNLPTPVLDNDAATKAYVENTINSANTYQYFALRRNGKYDPFVNLGSTTTGDFWVVVLREFTGAITSYFEGPVNLTPGRYIAPKRWKVGETIRIPYDTSHETSTRTNGTLIVRSNYGIIGNWGFTFRNLNPEPVAPPMLTLAFGNRTIGPDTSLDLSAIASSGSFSFTIKNIGANLREVYLELEPAYTYDSREDEISVWMSLSSSSATSRHTFSLSDMSSGDSIDAFVSIPYSNDRGFKWTIMLRGETTDGEDFSFRYGQFFIPAVL